MLAATEFHEASIKQLICEHAFSRPVFGGHGILHILGALVARSGGCAASEHSLKRRDGHKQAPANTDCGEFLGFCCLIGGPPRNLEDRSSLTDRHDPTWCAGFKSVFHRTLRY
jgi:hypothetical protein